MQFPSLLSLIILKYIDFIGGRGLLNYDGISILNNVEAASQDANGIRCCIDYCAHHPV
jgi:hypothetical protein